MLQWRDQFLPRVVPVNKRDESYLKYEQETLDFIKRK